jgi:chromosome segregation ATPase
MDTRLSTIEKNTGKNTVTLNQMNDKLNTLTTRVITAETDIVHVISRVADLEASSQGTRNLFDDVKEKTNKLSKDFEKLRKERKEGISSYIS